MRKEFNWVVLAIVLISSLIIIWRYNGQKAHIENRESQLARLRHSLIRQLDQSVRYDNTHLDIEGIQGLQLIYFMSDLHCNQCIDSILSVTQNFQSQNDDFHFSIIAAYKSDHDLQVFKRMHKLDCPVIRFDKNTYPILDSKVPLMFVYDSESKTAHSIFMPDPHDSELTRTYLGLIKRVL